MIRDIIKIAKIHVMNTTQDKPQIIAFYLPQYHPFKENDEWWGKGFTEWTNVAKAKKLFHNHYQPKIPSELGFYDLRLPVIREQQAKMAQEAGVLGFCYWHYWFGNGKRLMETIFDEVLKSGNPDFPFCLGWANHSWYAKLWNKNDTSKDRLLIEQTYPGDSDITSHFDYLLRAFNDPRYIKIDGAPILYIFAPQDLPQEYINKFQELAVKNGFKKGLYLVANLTMRNQTKEEYLSRGYSAVTYQRLRGKTNNSLIGRLKDYITKNFLQNILKIPIIYNYKNIYHGFINPIVDSAEDVIPTIIPNWDHTPRSGSKGFVLKNSTPELFQDHVIEAFEIIKNKKNKLLFLKSWNEWGEGNYMEPDLKYGRGYLDSLKRAFEISQNV